MTYRCAQDIVAEACKVFPDGIVAAPGAVKGFVGDGTFKDAQEGDFILCRNNAPLVDAFITLLRQGKKCTILGKEFGDELVSLIDSVEDVWGLEQVLENMISKLQKKGVKSPTKCEAYDKLNEKVNVLLSLYEYFGDLETVRSRIYDIFVENASRGITLSTIHKSKGLEAHGFQITEIFVQAQQNIHFLIQLVVCLTLGWTLNSLLLQLTYHVLKNLFKSPYVLDAVYKRYKFITEFLPKNCTLLPLP
jgi:hypothetical protein